jgi:hypothetical protein
MPANDGPTPSQVQQVQSNISNLMDWTNHCHDYMQDVINEVYDRLTESSGYDPGQEFITAMIDGMLRSISALPFPGSPIVAGFTSAFFGVYSGNAPPPSLKVQFASVWARFSATFLQVDDDLAAIHADVAGHWGDSYTDPATKTKYTIEQMGTGEIIIPAKADPDFQTMTDAAIAAYRVTLTKAQMGGKWNVLMDTCGWNFPGWGDSDAKAWTPGFVKTNPASRIRWNHVPSACCTPESEDVFEDFIGQRAPSTFDAGGLAPDDLMSWLCKTDQFGNVTNENGLVDREDLFNGWDGALKILDFCLPQSGPVYAADPSEQDLRDAEQWNALFSSQDRRKLEWGIVKRAYSDADFYRALVRDPRDALADHLGVPFPAGASIEIIREDAGEYKLVLPLAGIDFEQFKKPANWFQRVRGWFRRDA